MDISVFKAYMDSHHFPINALFLQARKSLTLNINNNLCDRMKDVNIPLPDFLEQQIAEIEVKINGKRRQYNFRIESFRWEPNDVSLTVSEKIDMLRDQLANYEKSWQLVQIFKPDDKSKFIQVLFRQKGITNP